MRERYGLSVACAQTLNRLSEVTLDMPPSSTTTMQVTASAANMSGPDGLLAAAAVLDAPPHVTVEGPADPPRGAGSGGDETPWYLRRDVQAEVAADHAVLRGLGVYSGSLVEVCLNA